MATKKPTKKAKKKTTQAKTWIVTTGGDRSIREVAKDCTAAGLEGAKVLKEVGTITGTASAAAVSKLRKVRGVTDVSPDTPIDIGPPDSSETW
jgi:hypothetical protein